MAFTSQFALSLELTRLLPPLKWAADKTADAIMAKARELRNSGSDIVVEEDLANVFGRCRISRTLASSFKTIITRSTSNVPLVESIMLQGGPGPTVVRAFQESHYFSMVVQISLLAWTFGTENLATAIADALRERSEGAPSTPGLQSSPSREGILGVLRACELQTSAFNWNLMLDAVSTTLGYGASTAPMDFPSFVLQGLLDMFPMVQTLPNDRFIYIRFPLEYDNAGFTALIVWAHHILDLTVQVDYGTHHGSSKSHSRFGSSGLEQVLIEAVEDLEEASIALLDSDKEQLLTIKPDPEPDANPFIGSTRKFSARGWGNTLLINLSRHYISSEPVSQANIADMQAIIVAFALIIAKNLVKDITNGVNDDSVAQNISPIAQNVNEQDLIEASRFLFDNPCISQEGVEAYVVQYSSKVLDWQLSRPPSFAAISQTDWEILCDYTQKVAIFLIALAHVTNLQDCGDLMFSRDDLWEMGQHPLCRQLQYWDRKKSLRIKDEAWLQALALPMISRRNHIWGVDWDKVCLVSDRGWSAWIPTLENVDPIYTRAGWVCLGRGTPCRNGVWKRGIRDAIYGTRISEGYDRIESSGESASLRCVEKVIFENPFCGEEDDVFLVCARLRRYGASPKQAIDRVGFKSLQTSLWWAQGSRHCSHGSRSPDNITLKSNCATIRSGYNILTENEERILICLTAHSIGARWLALKRLQEQFFQSSHDAFVRTRQRQVLLRANDCCFQCVVDQAIAQPGKWVIIL